MKSRHKYSFLIGQNYGKKRNLWIGLKYSADARLIGLPLSNSTKERLDLLKKKALVKL
jgi:hypothetical protein